MRGIARKRFFALFLALAALLTTLGILAGHKEQTTVLTGKVFIAPVSVVQEYAPGGFEAADKWLSSSPEVWQPVISAYLEKQANKKKGAFEVAVVSPEEFRQKLEAILHQHNLTGFFSKETGNFDEASYSMVMGEVANQLGATLLVPRIVQKQVTIKQLWTGEKAPKAKWDGVTRKMETGHHMFKHAYLRGDDVPVLSLRVTGFTPGRTAAAFTSDGGFDVVFKYSVGFFKAKEKDTDIGYLFSKKNQDHMEEACEEAFRSLLKS